MENMNRNERGIRNALNKYQWPEGTSFYIELEGDEFDSPAQANISINGVGEYALNMNTDEWMYDDDFEMALDELAEDLGLVNKPAVEMTFNTREYPSDEQLEVWKKKVMDQALDSLLFNAYDPAFGMIINGDGVDIEPDNLQRELGMSADELLKGGVSFGAIAMADDMHGGYSVTVSANFSRNFLLSKMELDNVRSDYSRAFKGQVDVVSTSSPLGETDKELALNNTRSSFLQKVGNGQGLEVAQLAMHLTDAARENGISLPDNFDSELTNSFGGSSIELFDKIGMGTLKNKIRTNEISTVLIDNHQFALPDGPEDTPAQNQAVRNTLR